MGNRLVASFTSVSVLALSVGMAAAQDAAPQASSAWFTDAQAALEEKLARQPITGKAKNVILLVADGNGVGTNYATRVFQGQLAGGHGDEHVLAYETLPYLALTKTYNTNAQTPDSAGTSTAMNAGVKTKAGVIGVDETLNRGDCSQVEGATVQGFGEMVAAMGKSVGVVSTARITHATPAAVYAHSADRNFEDNAELPEGCEVPDIAYQLLEKMKSGEVDLAMGGGRRHFIPEDFEDQEGKTGRRTDGRNLIEEAIEVGAQYAWNDETFTGLNVNTAAPMLGLFESSHMQYEHDRTGEPSLAEMTEAAISYLSANEEGFYLSIEAGRVDHANHDGNAHRTLTDGVAFADAVAKAMEMTNPEETLIIVTADHEHAIAFNGYCGRGSPILGLCHSIDEAGERHLDEAELADDGLPYTAIGYLNGPGSVMAEENGGWVGERREIKADEATDPDFVQQALLPLSSETHSPEDVATYAIGPWAHLFDGTIEQNYIYHVMHHAVTAE